MAFSAPQLFLALMAGALTLLTVLRMLADFVGEDVFLKGVSIYLKKLLYKSSVTKDLWDGVSKSSGIDVNKMMAEWILKVHS